MAELVWEPIVSDEVEKLAVPPVSGTADPRLEAPSLNCTVPVGVLPMTVNVVPLVAILYWLVKEGLGAWSKSFINHSEPPSLAQSVAR